LVRSNPAPADKPPFQPVTRNVHPRPKLRSEGAPPPIAVPRRLCPGRRHLGSTATCHGPPDHIGG
jgi:hypothetical protein